MTSKILYFIIFACFSFHAIAQSDFPYFASLKSDKVNLRTGPGERFPIDWIYKRAFLPIEVIDTFEYWYKIRDIDGTEGWVHKKMLSQKRTAITLPNQEHIIYRKESNVSLALAIIRGQIIVTLNKCSSLSDFCKVSFQNIDGYLLKKAMWGIQDGEEIK